MHNHHIEPICDFKTIFSLWKVSQKLLKVWYMQNSWNVALDAKGFMKARIQLISCIVTSAISCSIWVFNLQSLFSFVFQANPISRTLGRNDWFKWVEWLVWWRNKSLGTRWSQSWFDLYPSRRTADKVDVTPGYCVQPYLLQNDG